jgi:hypothetical protein
MSAETPRMAGLSGDHGWNEAEDDPMSRLSTAVLVLASGAVWGAVWVFSGLLPFSLVAGIWRSKQV